VVVGSGLLLLAYSVWAMVRYAGLRPLDESLVDVEPDGLRAVPPAVAGAD
jgi:hypothetical protein